MPGLNRKHLDEMNDAKQVWQKMDDLRSLLTDGDSIDAEKLAWIYRALQVLAEEIHDLKRPSP